MRITPTTQAYAEFRIFTAGVAHMDGNRRVPAIKMRGVPVAGGRERWVTMPQSVFFAVVEPREQGAPSGQPLSRVGSTHRGAVHSDVCGASPRSASWQAPCRTLSAWTQ